jgi:hypothetical protein
MSDYRVEQLICPIKAIRVLHNLRPHDLPFLNRYIIPCPSNLANHFFRVKAYYSVLQEVRHVYAGDALVLLLEPLLRGAARSGALHLSIVSLHTIIGSSGQCRHERRDASYAYRSQWVCLQDEWTTFRLVVPRTQIQMFIGRHVVISPYRPG